MVQTRSIRNLDSDYLRSCALVQHTRACVHNLKKGVVRVYSGVFENVEFEFFEIDSLLMELARSYPAKMGFLVDLWSKLQNLDFIKRFRCYGGPSYGQKRACRGTGVENYDF